MTDAGARPGFRAGREVRIMIVYPPTYRAALLTMFGPSADAVVEAVVRLTQYDPAKLVATSGPIKGQIEIRERAEVGRGMLAALIDDGPPGPEIGQALRNAPPPLAAAGPAFARLEQLRAEASTEEDNDDD